MTVRLLLTVVILLLCSAAWALNLPDPSLTPGAVMTSVTVQMICARGYGRLARHVTRSERKHVILAYLAAHPTWPARPYEVDHLVPLELGGSNDPSNLWPQPWGEARQKDRLENWLHYMVCSGQMSLWDAQARAVNWGRGRPRESFSSSDLDRGDQVGE